MKERKCREATYNHASVENTEEGLVGDDGTSPGGKGTRRPLANGQERRVEMDRIAHHPSRSSTCGQKGVKRLSLGLSLRSRRIEAHRSINGSEQDRKQGSPVGSVFRSSRPALSLEQGADCSPDEDHERSSSKSSQHQPSSLLVRRRDRESSNSKRFVHRDYFPRFPTPRERVHLINGPIDEIPPNKLDEES